MTAAGSRRAGAQSSGSATIGLKARAAGDKQAGMDGEGFTDDPADVRRAIDGLREKGSESGLPSALEQVIESATSLFNVTGSGIMFADDEHELHYVAATDA